jgi:hypothetical protein
VLILCSRCWPSADGGGVGFRIQKAVCKERQGKEHRRRIQLNCWVPDASKAPSMREHDDHCTKCKGRCKSLGASKPASMVARVLSYCVALPFSCGVCRLTLFIAGPGLRARPKQFFGRPFPSPTWGKLRFLQ